MARAFVILIVICLIAKPIVNAIGDGPKEVEKWIKNHSLAKEKTTKFHFYFHVLVQGNKINTVAVVRVNMSATSPTYFGMLTIMDDPLTVGPELSSRTLGYAQGSYVTSSLEEISFFCSLSFLFTEGKNNGSTISVLDRNSPSHKFRETPIVGGTGRFRLAHGMVTLENYYWNLTTGNAIVEVHGVVLHY